MCFFISFLLTFYYLFFLLSHSSNFFFFWISQSKDINYDDVNDAILESTRSVGSAAEFLIQAAASAQSERNERIVNSNERYNDDVLWANGLISAAQQISSTIRTLVLL
jgi:hypothetical protein